MKTYKNPYKERSRDDGVEGSANAFHKTCKFKEAMAITAETVFKTSKTKTTSKPHSDVYRLALPQWQGGSSHDQTTWINKDLSLWRFFTTVWWISRCNGHSSACCISQKDFPGFYNKGGLPHSFAKERTRGEDIYNEFKNMLAPFINWWQLLLMGHRQCTVCALVL